MNLNVKIITPQKIAYESETDMVTAPALDGEITILPSHTSYFSPLEEGIIELKSDKNEFFFAIGGGYIQTDGKIVTILVSRAKGQDEIDEHEITAARGRADKMIATAKTDEVRKEAIELLRRSTIDLKLLSKIKRKRM